MQNSMESRPGTLIYHGGNSSHSAQEKKSQEVREKLRRLQEVLPEKTADGSALRHAIRHLQTSRDKRRMIHGQNPAKGFQQTPHHANYSAGYGDSVRDARRLLVQNMAVSQGVRSNVAQYITHKQEYSRSQQQLYHHHQQHPMDHSAQYSFYYPAGPAAPTPAAPYTYWKPW